MLVGLRRSPAPTTLCRVNRPTRTLAVAIAVLLTGCASPASRAGDRTQVTGAVTHSGDLRGYLMAPPADATDVRKPRLETAQQDADGAEDPSERLQTLTEIGFKSEAVEAFTTASGNDVEIVLVQSRTPAGASKDLANEEGYAKLFRKWSVPGRPSAVVYQDPSLAPAGSAGLEALAQAGDVLVIVFDTMPPPGSPTEPTALLSDQINSLASVGAASAST
jgi:hypothetical protein